jgi:hypothetical protein
VAIVSYQEKKTIVSIVTGILIMVAYCIYALNRYSAQQADLGDMKAWGIMMLIFIGVGVAVAIVMQIVFHIAMSIAVAVRERDCDDKAIEKAVEAAVVEDEMDKLIELKAMKVGFAIAGAGFLGALASVALGCPGGVMLNILFLSFSLGSLVEGALSLYYYRAGVKNG